MKTALIIAVLVTLCGCKLYREDPLLQLIELRPNFLNQASFFAKKHKGVKYSPIPPHSPPLAFVRSNSSSPSPRVICGSDSIGLMLEEKMDGRIYASHREDNQQCTQFLTKVASTNGGRTDSLARFDVPIKGPCGVRRKRVRAPLSRVEYSVRFIVSYDFAHMTEEDRVFDVICSYRVDNITLESYYEAVSFQPTNVTASLSLPLCRYSLRHSSPDGPTLGRARIGEMVYHRWECPSDDFRFKVYRCFVHNGSKKSFMIVDDDGCSLDEDILPHPTYVPNDGVVYAASHAFRFARSMRVHFNCLLAICHKSDDDCMRGIPPHCARSQRKRQLPSNSTVEERLIKLHNARTGDNVSFPLEEGVSSEGVSRRRKMELHAPPMQVDSNDQGATVQASVCSVVEWIVLLVATNLLSVALTILIYHRFTRCRDKLSLEKIRSKGKGPLHERCAF